MLAAVLFLAGGISVAVASNDSSIPGALPGVSRILPETVPGLTINRLCASGLNAVGDAAPVHDVSQAPEPTPADTSSSCPRLEVLE